MEPSWSSVFLGDAPLQIEDGDRGSNYPKRTEFTISGHCIFLNTGNVTRSGFNFDSLDFISEERDRLLRKGKLRRQDIVLTTRGTVGNVAYYNDAVPFDHVRINSGMVIFRPDQALLHPRFLYLYLRSRIFSDQVKALQTGSAQPQLPIRDIKKIRLNFPGLIEQKRIAHILGSLDDKVDLNRQINTTLESMAQALFKSWFVDFDPVIDNALAAGNDIPEPLQAKAEKRKALGDQRKPLPDGLQKQFPDRFVFTEEMGWVPEGWKVSQIGDQITRLSVGKKYSQKTVSETGAVAVLDQGKSGVIGFHDEEPGIKASPSEPVIVFANHTCYMRMVMHDFSAIQNVLPFVGKGVDIYWLFFATFGRQTFSEYKGHWPDFILHKLAVPTNGLDTVFGSYVANKMQGVFARENQNNTLSSLREALLPKLLSGELRIPEAEKQVAGAV